MIVWLITLTVDLLVFSQDIQEIAFDTIEEDEKRQENLKSLGLADIFLINLDTSPDRLSNFMTQMNYLRLPFKRLSAVDGKKIKEFLNSKSANLYNFHPDTLFRLDWLHPSQKSISESEFEAIGWWQSHLQTYFAILENYKKTLIDGPVLIFEDDVILDKSMPDIIKQSLPQIPNDWDLFFIGYTSLPSCLEDVTETVYKANDIIGTHANIVNGHRAAKKLIDMINLMEATAIDYILRFYYEEDLNAYVLYPNPVALKYDWMNKNIQINEGIRVVLKDPILVV